MGEAVEKGQPPVARAKVKKGEELVEAVALWPTNSGNGYKGKVKIALAEGEQLFIFPETPKSN